MILLPNFTSLRVCNMIVFFSKTWINICTELLLYNSSAWVDFHQILYQIYLNVNADTCKILIRSNIYLKNNSGNIFEKQSYCLCREIWSGRWSAQARNIGRQCWLSILNRWSIEAWMTIASLYWLVILAPKSLSMIGRESLPELSRWSF